MSITKLPEDPNYFYIEFDESHGMHNPAYTIGILRSSTEDLTGGRPAGADYSPPP